MAANLKASLKRRLAKAERVAVLGVGSSLRADDAAGVVAAQALDTMLAKQPARVKVAVFHGHTAPENLTGEIRRFQPTHLLILDAADVGGKPGHIELIDPDVVTHNPSASTHTLPFGVLASYLRESFPCDVVILGIQPAKREFSETPSPAVSKAARRLAGLIAESLR